MMWDNRVRFSIEKPTEVYGRYALTAQYTAQRYFFPDTNAFVAGTNDPWDLVHRVNLGANAFQPIHEKWALVASGTGTWAAAAGASLADGMSWAFTFGIGERRSWFV